MTALLLPPGQASQLANAAYDRLTNTIRPAAGEPLRCGVDLGTASIIVVVVDSTGTPLASAIQPCQVARDGLVVDYLGAVGITRKLVAELSERLGRELSTTAIAVPPGTALADASTHRHVAEAAELEVTAILDEPTAAAAVLGVTDRAAVVDIGGGTTGLAVFENGQVAYVADEATGGTHMTLVIAGRLGLTFDEAEAFKQDPANASQVRAITLPTAEKMASIVARHISGREVHQLYLVGGACGVDGIENVFQSVTGKVSVKPSNPMMITPLGIALNCVPSQ